MDELLQAWGANVRAARERSGLTQKELAKAAGTTQQWLSVIEKGAVEPRVDMRWRLADALGLSEHELFPTARAAS